MNENYGERLCIEQGRPEDAEELIALLADFGRPKDIARAESLGRRPL